MKILKLHFAHLRNEVHYQFLLLVTKLFGVYPNVANIVTNLLLKFYELTALEESVERCNVIRFTLAATNPNGSKGQTLSNQFQGFFGTCFYEGFNSLV
jgi:hypothetical protein